MKHRSFWFETREPLPAYPALAGDRRVEVAVVGAGITGMTAALLLARAGRSVAAWTSMRWPAGPRATARPRSRLSTG